MSSRIPGGASITPHESSTARSNRAISRTTRPTERSRTASMQPADRLDPQPWMTAPETVAVMAALSAAGGEARFVGGCVRDALLDRRVSDIDIATHEPPERVMNLLARAGIKAIPTGIKHGTVTAVIGARHF